MKAKTSVKWTLLLLSVKEVTSGGLDPTIISNGTTTTISNGRIITITTTGKTITTTSSGLTTNSSGLTTITEAINGDLLITEATSGDLLITEATSGKAEITDSGRVREEITEDGDSLYKQSTLICFFISFDHINRLTVDIVRDRLRYFIFNADYPHSHQRLPHPWHWVDRKNGKWPFIQDPYVRIAIGNQQQRTRTCHEGGKNPTWG